MNLIEFGDCRDTMRRWAEQGVKAQMCVTSPPYFGLRDYGHEGQIGLEKTPEQYIAAMVEVFRCVRDVLADDGTLWLNLGSSYASGDKTPSQSLLRQRVPPCDTRGTAPQDSQGAGRACLGSYDEPQGETRCHRENNAHICRCDEQVEPQIEPTGQGNERLGCDQSSRLTFQPGDHPSTTDATSQNVQDALHPSGEALACQRAPRTSLRDAQEFSDKSACTCGTSRMLQPLAVHTKGKESFFSACRRSDCNGIGRCGYCFGSLTTASLNIKQKDELNIPHLVAMALQADGWVLRQTICWAKPNPMPESVRDRCTKAHEYIFLLSKSERYFYNSEAIKEPAAASSIARWNQNVDAQRGSDRVPGKTNGTMKAVGGPRSKANSFKREGSKREQAIPGQGYGTHRPDREESTYDIEKRNRRSVWTVATKPYNGKKALTDYVGDDGKPYTASPDCPIHGHLARFELASVAYKVENKCTCNEVTIDHFATFPPALIEPCILAGSRPGDIVLDPFMGSGTTAAVALQHGRQYLGCELNAEYGALQAERINEATEAAACAAAQPDLFERAE